MDSNIRDSISTLLGSTVTEVSPVSGGDISSAYLLQAGSEKFFCKINSGVDALSMFRVEKRGLETIASKNTIRVPEVYACSELVNGACLILEYIESGRADEKSMSKLGEELAGLHQSSDDYFGLDHDNYIGSLHQSNKKHKIWTEFYVEERLLPQLELAASKGLLGAGEIPSNKRMADVLTRFFEGIIPSLLHGDLWGGNYLISSGGIPFLIDPAIYYGHSEVDIAMSRLFGGFGHGFYSAYENVNPPDHHSHDRIKIYQLYYLLVHLNLFGSSYKSSVITILKSYFY